MFLYNYLHIQYATLMFAHIMNYNSFLAIFVLYNYKLNSFYINFIITWF